MAAIAIKREKRGKSNTEEGQKGDLPLFDFNGVKNSWILVLKVKKPHCCAVFFEVGGA